MAKEKDDVRTDRRGFLKLAGLGGVATGAAIASGTAEAAEAPVTGSGSGYAETDHVKMVYKTARF